MIKKYKKIYKEMPITVKASLWYLIASFLQKGISSITGIVFTRLMTTSEYGAYRDFLSIQGVVAIVVTLCIYYDVCAQGLVKFERRKSQYVSSLQGLTLVLVIIWMVIYLISSSILNKYLKFNTIQMICMLITIWATAAYQFWAAEKRVTYDYKSLVTLTIIVTLFKPSLEVMFVIFGKDKVTARIIAVTIAEIICYTGLFIQQMLKGKCFYSKKDWKYALHMAFPLIPHYMSQRILQSADIIMIRRMIGESEAGIYGLGYSISALMTLFTSAITQTINPWLYKKIKERKFDEIPEVVYSLLIFVAVINILLIGLAPEIISIAAPSSYYDSIWIIPPVAISIYFIFAYSFFSAFEFYFEKTIYATIATAIGAFTNIFLNYILIHKYGYIAAGYTTLICYSLYTISHYIFMTKICKKELSNNKVYSFKILAAITLTFVIVGLSFLFTYSNAWLRYSLLVIISLIIFVYRKRAKKVILHILKARKD